jgi:hypothetical protein
LKAGPKSLFLSVPALELPKDSLTLLCSELFEDSELLDDEPKEEDSLNPSTAPSKVAEEPLLLFDPEDKDSEKEEFLLLLLLVSELKDEELEEVSELEPPDAEEPKEESLELRTFPILRSFSVAVVFSIGIVVPLPTLLSYSIIVCLNIFPQRRII